LVKKFEIEVRKSFRCVWLCFSPTICWSFLFVFAVSQSEYCVARRIVAAAAVVIAVADGVNHQQLFDHHFLSRSVN
jgi:hypothetical protein